MSTTKSYRIIMYIIVGLCAYIPQFIFSFNPMKDWLNSFDIIFITSFHFKTFFTWIAIICILVIVINLFSFKYSHNKRMHYILFIISIFIMAISLIFSVMEIIISIYYQPTLLPMLLSIIIGVIGSFLVSCFYQPYCTNQKLDAKNHFLKINL